MMNVNSLGSYTQNAFGSNADWGESKAIDFMSLVLERHKKLANENSSFSNTYSITAPRVEKAFQVGKTESIYPSNSQKPFSNALSQKQSAVSELEYHLAAKRLQELMKEISAFALTEQGEKSELSFYLNSLSDHFSTTLAFKDEALQSIKEQVANYNGDKESPMNSIDSYFTLFAPPYEQALAFFDYASDKIEGLPVAQIMQDLSTIKSWWDNNSRECLKLDDGTKVGFTHTFDKDGNITNTTLVTSLPNGVQRKFNTANLDDENSQILFEMFKQRENLNGLESENLLLNSSENSNLQAKLNLINSNANLSKTNSNDSLLKALLNSVSNDENLLKDLKV